MYQSTKLLNTVLLNWDAFGESILETVYIILFCSPFILVFGLLIGLLMYTTSSSYLKQNKYLFVIHNIVVVTANIIKVIPFVVLVLGLIPLTQFITGTILGWKGALPALIIAASPYFGQHVFNTLKMTRFETIEAGTIMGASRIQIILILLHESVESIISWYTMTIITLIGMVASAGIIGVSGIGNYCYNAAIALDTGWLFIGILTISMLILFIYIAGYLCNKLLFTRHKKKY